MITMDLNAGYCCCHRLCCFSMIRSEGHEALMGLGEGVTICQHHLYMAFMRVARGAPAGWRSGASSGTSWGSTQEANQESPTVMTCLPSAPMSLRSAIFDAVPSTIPSCSLKADVLRERTPYAVTLSTERCETILTLSLCLTPACAGRES